MTIGPGKRKNRRSTTENGDLDFDSSSSNRSRSSRNDSSNRSDAQNDNGNIDGIRRDRTASDTDSLPQQTVDDAPRKTADGLESTTRRDLNRENTPDSISNGSPTQRRKSLSDLAATLIDSNATIPDLRSARFRSRSDGEDSAVRPRQFTESDIDTLLDSMEQTDVDSLPLVKALSLNDSSGDADDENFIEDAETDLEVTVRRSSYEQDQRKWSRLPQAADSALKALQAEFANVETVSSVSEQYLSDLLPNIYADDGQGVSLESLNDIYFLAKDQIDKTVNNPLLPEDQLPDAVKLRTQRLIELVSAIDKLEIRTAFLMPEEAQAYNAAKLESTNLGSSSLTTHDREVLQTYGKSLTDSSFNRTQENSEVHKAISDYRREHLDRLTTDLQALGAEFQAKFIKKEHHKKVLEAQAALLKAIDRVKPLLDSPSDPNTQEAMDQFNLAMNAMKAMAQTYLTGSDRKNRIKERLTACNNVLDRIDRLTVTDDKLLTWKLAKSFRTLEEARNVLNTLDPEVANTFSAAMDNLFFNVSPSADAQSIFDSLGAALSLAALKQGVDSTQPFKGTKGGSDYGAAATTAFALLEDVYKSYSFIKGLPGDREAAGGITIQKMLEGSEILTTAAKNTTAAIKTGLEIAQGLGTASQAAGTAANVASGISSAAGVVIGTGVAVHGGLVVHKTSLRVESAEGIADDKIRTQLLDRIQKKRRRALLEAVGGAVAVTAGTLAIAALIVGTGGTAAPVLAAVGLAVAAGGAVLGAGLSSERGIRAATKSRQGTKGKEREALATEIFVHMNQLLASGNYNKAKELAQALTNNKYKQNLMLRGVDAGASLEDQKAALTIMRDKLKTW